MTCKATIGSTSNPDHQLQVLGKAGRSRWLGKRPRVRGVAMNPVDHPMGGGEGRASGTSVVIIEKTGSSSLWRQFFLICFPL